MNIRPIFRCLFEAKPRPWYADPIQAYDRGYALGHQAGRNEVQIEHAKALHRRVEALKSQERRDG